MSQDPASDPTTIELARVQADRDRLAHAAAELLELLQHAQPTWITWELTRRAHALAELLHRRSR